MYVGMSLLLLGLLFDQSKLLFVIGHTLSWTGMVQSYYGTVLEDHGRARVGYAIAGVPLALGLMYFSYLTILDYLVTWGAILIVVAVVIALQAFISYVAIKFWQRRIIPL